MKKFAKEYPHYLIGIILILLKITNVLNISWFFILLPFWWWVPFMAIVFVILLIYYIIFDKKARWRNK